ncbi:hypothetical protein NESM_000477000 [Novymonas esmeraldas]|uniref:Uncharacterized protein n=1 Tax=Novymonas esmeraldas TaxID=1808958 RepID=A0AAW0EQS7_9TRYP
MLQRTLCARCPADTSRASVCVRFCGLGRYDYVPSITWPPTHDSGGGGGGASLTHDGVAAHSSSLPSGGGAVGGEYRSYRRSPFAVLRSRQSRVGRCASAVLPSSYNAAIAPSYGGGSGRGLAACGHRLCCCSALFYPSPTPSGIASASAEDGAQRVLHTFLWALKLANLEGLLRTAVGDDLYRRLLGHTDAAAAAAAATVVLTCNDLAAVAQERSSGVSADARAESDTSVTSSPSPAAPSTYTACLLLSADEENRVKWLQEELPSMEYHDYYSRAPSLRALYVMWSIQEQQQRWRAAAVGGGGGGGGGDGSPPPQQGDRSGAGPRLTASAAARTPKSLLPPPTMDDVRRVLMRMEERHVEVTMADTAALAAIGVISCDSGTSIPSSEFWGAIARHLQPQQLAEALQTNTATEALLLQHVLMVALLLRYTLLATAEVPLASPTPTPASPSSSPSSTAAAGSVAAKLQLPVAAFEAASVAVDLRRRLAGWSGGDGPSAPPSSSSPAYAVLVRLCDEVSTHVYDLAGRLQIAASSPHLPDFTTWLLREMVTSAVCESHFKRLVDRSTTEALVTLERSGLVNRSSMDLRAVVLQLLPLLESCGSEDLYASVLRDVLSALEERARRDRRAFSSEDMRYLAELGTKLFASSAGDGTAGRSGLFDETVRGHMEELHVMDGGPWALCVSSYRSLKEMAQGIIRDQRRLKQQVQEQLRQLSNSTTLSAVMGGGDAAAQRQDSSTSTATPPSTPPVPHATSAGSTDSTASAARTDAVGENTGGEAVRSAPSSTSAGAAAAGSDAAMAPSNMPRMPASPMLRQRFLVLVEELVKAQVDESSHDSERPIVVSSEMFAFVAQHVPVPNIQDEYRRKIFLLVNVAEAPETTRRRRAANDEARSSASASRQDRRRFRRHRHSSSSSSSSGDAAAASTAGAAVDLATEAEARVRPGVEEEGGANDPHGGANDIPAELRLLVSSLPLTLSPWASVMILREVLAESAGRNPRYTYVLNAAIDLQLPMSTTRSRIATTLNMWRFLNTQAHKLSLKESVVMKQRCAWNLPMAYVLSSYWSLLTWLLLASIIALNVVGIDFESQIVANSLFRMFAPWEEICAPPTTVDGEAEAWTTQAVADLAADYFELTEIADRRREEHHRSGTNVLLSSASYLFLGYDDQRRPMTVIPIGSDCSATAEDRAAEEYASATAVLRELSLHVPFPFFVDVERPLPVEYVERRIAERIRRVSFDNTWFLPRMIIRTFPLGRQYTEHNLVLHTCTQANLTRRRITFLLYMHDGVPVTPQFIQGLNDSFLSRHANLVLVVHEGSLVKGGTTPAALSRIGSSSTDGAAAAAAASIVSAATEMMDAVMPGDRSDSSPSTPPSHQMRVLPYCRQYYCNDDPVVAAPHRAAGTASLATRDGGGVAEAEWWVRAMGSVRRWWGGVAVDSEAAAAARVPHFAASFSSCRASLQRSRERRERETEEDAAAAAARQVQQDQHEQRRCQPSSDSGRRALGRWVSWLGNALACATAAALRVTRTGGGGSGAVAEDGVESPARRTAAPQPHQPPRDDPAAAPATDTPAAEDVAGADGQRGLVTVSFTALHRLMSEVSAPVLVTRGKASSSTAAAAPATARDSTMPAPDTVPSTEVLRRAPAAASRDAPSRERWL